MTPIDKNKKSTAWPLSQQSARLRQQNLGFRTRKGERDLFYHEKKSVPSREEDRIITRGKSYAHEECNVLELVDNFGFLISFFFDKFIC